MYALPTFATPRPDDNISHLLNKIHHANALELLARLPDASIDLIATDPPYHAIVASEWDNQWSSKDDFIVWLSPIIDEFKRVLKANGSLYVFASHKLHAYVEVAIAEQFKVLNNIVWVKSQATTKQADRTIMRSYIPTTEHAIFAEKKNGDMVADDIAGYTDADRTLKKRIFGDKIKIAMKETNTNTHDLVEAVGAYRKYNNGGAASNWTAGYNIPTKKQYELMRSYFNMSSDGQYLKTEYEDLKTEYEDLRRFFNLDIAGDNECNVWYFKPPSQRNHPTQKPLSIMEHIIRISSREKAIVCDPFSGSGTTAVACRKTNRQFICGDNHLPYVELARQRLQTTDPYQATINKDGSKQLSLFEDMTA